MRGMRTTPYAGIALAALAMAALAACGSSGEGGATTTPTASPTASPTSSGTGDLQLRAATSASKPPSAPCTSEAVAPEKPVYRCDREGTGYALGPAFVTGAMVVSAEARQAEYGPEVQVVLNEDGKKALADATTRMAPLGPPQGLLGIMSGGRLYGAPLVQTPVLGGVFVIGGLANMADAVSLAAAIRG